MSNKIISQPPILRSIKNFASLQTQIQAQPTIIKSSLIQVTPIAFTFTEIQKESFSISTRSFTPSQQKEKRNQNQNLELKMASDIEERFERDLDLAGGRGGGGGGGRRGGKKDGKRGGGSENREVLISKALSRLLRHAADEAGLVLDEEGFARVDQVMKWPRLRSLQITFSDIQTAVSDNAKQRFSIKPNPSINPAPSPTSTQPSDYLIRANQGHSIKSITSENLLTPITLERNNVPEVVVHGTYFGCWEAILKSGGLSRMSRNHVHFSTGLPDNKLGVKSGMRNDAEVLIFVDVEACLRDAVANQATTQDTATQTITQVEGPDGEGKEGEKVKVKVKEEKKGLKWWISENGVVLTEGDEQGFVPTRFFKRVVGRRSEVCGVLFEDGVEVAELPEAVRGRKIPMGKGGRGRGGGGGRAGRGNRGGGRGRGDRGRGRGGTEIGDGGEVGVNTGS